MRKTFKKYQEVRFVSCHEENGPIAIIERAIIKMENRFKGEAVRRLWMARARAHRMRRTLHRPHALASASPTVAYVRGSSTIQLKGTIFDMNYYF